MSAGDPSIDAAREHVQRLFVAHAAVLRGFVCAILGDLHLADDVCQNVFLVASRKADDFRPGSDFFAWIKAIARFEVLKAAAARRQRQACLGQAAIDSLIDAAPPIDRDWAQEQRLLGECLARITPRQREIIDLRYRDDLLPAGIAARLGWSVNAVNVALSRIRAALRRCLQARLAQTSAPETR